MPRGFMAHEIAGLENQIMEMAAYVERAVHLSVEALRALDRRMADAVVAMDHTTDQFRMNVESTCLKLIATQQPVAKDLRVIMATFSIASDLERIGDHATDLAQIVLDHPDEPLLKPLIDIPRMTDVALMMLRDALTALVNEDERLARDLIDRDTIVDDLCNQVFRELLIFMMADPKTVARATYLMLAAQHVERIADLATNVAERTLYISTGVYEELNP